MLTFGPRTTAYAIVSFACGNSLMAQELLVALIMRLGLSLRVTAVLSDGQ